MSISFILQHYAQFPDDWCVIEKKIIDCDTFDFIARSQLDAFASTLVEHVIYQYKKEFELHTVQHVDHRYALGLWLPLYAKDAHSPYDNGGLLITSAQYLVTCKLCGEPISVTKEYIHSISLPSTFIGIRQVVGVLCRQCSLARSSSLIICEKRHKDWKVYADNAVHIWEAAVTPETAIREFIQEIHNRNTNISRTKKE